MKYDGANVNIINALYTTYGGKRLMKKILSAIGGFFVAIWRWIKETAWVQPLLIVGIIFGVIFSIPSIVEGFQGISDKKNSPDTYYNKYKVSLVGAENSPAQKLVDEIYDNENGRSSSLDGKKFFIVFVQSNNRCAVCDSAKEGFEYLEKNANVLLGGEKFEFKTIVVDEEFKKKDKEDWKKEGSVKDDDFASTAFEAFLVRNADKFEGYAENAQNSYYYLNSGITETQIDNLYSADESKFQTPTVLQVDFTANATKSGSGGPGVVGAFIGLDSKESTKLSKAEFFADAWNYENRFGSNFTL